MVKTTNDVHHIKQQTEPKDVEISGNNLVKPKVFSNKPVEIETSFEDLMDNID